jgi:hypothetical protein
VLIPVFALGRAQELLALGTISLVKSAVANVVYRGVAAPPINRATVQACPAGTYNINVNVSCAFNCCNPCVTTCPAYAANFINTCSARSDNTCLNDAQFQVYQASLSSASSSNNVGAIVGGVVGGVAGVVLIAVIVIVVMRRQQVNKLSKRGVSSGEVGISWSNGASLKTIQPVGK